MSRLTPFIPFIQSGIWIYEVEPVSMVKEIILILNIHRHVVLKPLFFQLESLITKDAREAEIQGVIAEVPEMILKCVSQDEAALAVAQKAIIINGQRKILISGSIHYPRSTPDMWEGLIQNAKDRGLDVFQTYVFWNVHEPSPGNYNFEGRNDLVRFVKTVQKAGLYVHLRIGHYVCVEWNFGGFSVWLKYVPGISFRTNNEPFKPTPFYLCKP